MVQPSLALIGESDHPVRVLIYVLVNGNYLESFHDFRAQDGDVPMGPGTKIPVGSTKFAFLEEYNGYYSGVTLRSGMKGEMHLADGSPFDIQDVLNGRQSAFISLGSVADLRIEYDGRKIAMLFRRPTKNAERSSERTPIPPVLQATRAAANQPVLRVYPLTLKDPATLERIWKEGEDEFAMGMVVDIGTPFDASKGVKIGPGTDYPIPELSETFMLVHQRLREPVTIYLRGDRNWSCWVKDPGTRSWKTFADLQCEKRVLAFNNRFEVTIEEESSAIVLVEHVAFLMWYTAQQPVRTEPAEEPQRPESD